MSLQDEFDKAIEMFIHNETSNTRYGTANILQFNRHSLRPKLSLQDIGVDYSETDYANLSILPRK
jgi:hypothetical protein